MLPEGKIKKMFTYLPVCQAKNRQLSGITVPGIDRKEIIHHIVFVYGLVLTLFLVRFTLNHEPYVLFHLHNNAASR